MLQHAVNFYRNIEIFEQLTKYAYFVIMCLLILHRM